MQSRAQEFALCSLAILSSLSFEMSGVHAGDSLDNRYTPELIESVHSILKDEGGSLTRWNKIVDLLASQHITYETKLTPWEVQVHIMNRGGLGLNAHEVHQKLAMVKEIGADPRAVHRATAFELPPQGPERTAATRFNEKLIERSGGLLAPLSGRERVASTACSHFNAACRAASHGCKTTITELKDSNGCINKQQLVGGDAAFLDLIDNGWKWLVVPYQCEVIWGHALADLAQDALNAEQAAFSQASELQVMMSMANRYVDIHASSTSAEKNAAWASITTGIKATGPPCAGYLQVLADFVQEFAGGPGAPVVRYLEAFAKVYGRNRVIGQTFFEAVTSLQFQTKSTKFPFLRSACIVANLISPKVGDGGLAKLLKKSDIQALTKKDRLLEAIATETMLSEVWKALQLHSETKALSVETCNDLFGRLSSRLILFMCKKQKEGPEQSSYKSATEIKQQYNKEVDAALLGTSVSCSTEDTGAQDVQERAKPTTIDEASDPVFIAAENGFVQGRYYVEKGDGQQTVFQLTALEAGGATLSNTA